jgi:hypothetical protein
MVSNPCAGWLFGGCAGVRKAIARSKTPMIDFISFPPEVDCGLGPLRTVKVGF